MKKTINLFLLVALFLGITTCKKDSSNNNSQISGTNHPPNKPSNPNPSDKATNQSTTLSLSWQCTDPDGNQLSYDVYFGTTNDPPSVKADLTGTSFNPGTLKSNTTYYWKIVAWDNYNTHTYSDLWSFTTGTLPPNKPTNPSPSDGATFQSLSSVLSWQCTDPDNNPMTYDVYLGTSNNPSKVKSDNSGTTYNPGSLNNKTKYYWKIVAKDNHSNSTTGDIWSFTIQGDCGNITDADGNVYNTLTIGTQCWMQQNLKTIKYNDETAIPNVTDNTAWNKLSTPGYCWYNNDAITYKSTYGALYNWYAVYTGKLCPAGWHVPTDAEWTTLTDYLGGENVAGGKMKEAGTAHWNSTNTGADNGSGFTGLPGGHRNYGDGLFYNLGYSGYWWSAWEHNGTGAWYRELGNNGADVYRSGIDKADGVSVRCLKDY